MIIIICCFAPKKNEIFGAKEKKIFWPFPRTCRAKQQKQQRHSFFENCFLFFRTINLSRTSLVHFPVNFKRFNDFFLTTIIQKINFWCEKSIFHFVFFSCLFWHETHPCYVILGKFYSFFFLYLESKSKKKIHSFHWFNDDDVTNDPFT